MAQVITQRQLDQFKLLFPEDAKLQDLTVEELIVNTDGGAVDWKSLPTKPQLLEASVWDCVEGVGFVIFDCICLFLGDTGLRAGTTAKEAEQIAKAAEPVIPKIKQYINTIRDSASSTTEVASAVFSVISTIYSGGCLGAVIGSFLNTLEWYQWVLYGTTALATIIAAVATDGAAEVAAIVIELSTFGFLVDDSVKCAKACSF